MPPSRPLSAEELIEVLRRAADAQLQLSAAVNRHATATERLLPSFERLCHDIYDVKADRETDVINHQQTINEIGKQLAVLAAAVTRLPGDVTGAFKLAQAEEKTPAERMFARLERASTTTKIWTLVFVIVLIASGWLTHLIFG